MSSYSSLDPLLPSRRPGVPAAAVDLESQYASSSSSNGVASSSSSSSSSVGLARRMSPRLPPLSQPSAASTFASHPLVTSNGMRHHTQHSAPSAFSLLSSPASSLASPASTHSAIRYLLALLLAAGCVALLTAGWDYSALTRTPALVCANGHSCVPAQRTPQHIHSQPTTSTTTNPITPASTDAATDAATDATAAAATAPTTTATPVPATLPSARGPPYRDSLASLFACPPLSSLLAANAIQATDDESGAAVAIPVDQPKLNSLIANYEAALSERLSAQQLTFDDWRSGDGRVTMAQYYAQHAGVGVDLRTNSTRNTAYTISTWDNICVTFGGEKDPHLVLLGSDVAAQQQLIDTQLLHPTSQQMSWLPPRWCNDQGRLSAQAKANDDWLWIAADEGTAAFHQFEVTRAHTTCGSRAVAQLRRPRVNSRSLAGSCTDTARHVLAAQLCACVQCSGTSTWATSSTSRCGRYMSPRRHSPLRCLALRGSLG